MNTVHHTIKNRLPSTLPFVSAFMTGAIVLTGCQSTNLGQSNAMTATQTPMAAKKTVATALQKQRRQSFSYHANLEMSNEQRFATVNIKEAANHVVASDYIGTYCKDTHDEAYAALLAKAEGQNKEVLAMRYDAQRAVLKQSYLECVEAYRAWQESQYDSEIVVPAYYQQLFDNYDDKLTAQDIRNVKLLDAYLLKPLSINSQGVYQPMAGKATMLASAQYQVRNHRSSINQPVYIDFKNGNIYLWADNVAMINSKLLDDKLGTKWQNKWLKIALDDGTLPKGFGNELIKSHFAALDITFDSASISQFDYVAPNTLVSTTPKLPAHQLPAMLASDKVIRRVQSAVNYEQAYKNYMRIFYDRITKQYPELLKANEADVVDDTASNTFTSKAFVQQILATIKGLTDNEAQTSKTKVETTSMVQTLYGFDKRGQLRWQHLRSELPSETHQHKGLMMDVLQQYSAIRAQDKAFPNLSHDVQVPNARNSVDVREYGDELIQYYRDGHGAALGKMMFAMLPMAKERLDSSE